MKRFKYNKIWDFDKSLIAKWLSIYHNLIGIISNLVVLFTVDIILNYHTITVDSILDEYP